VSTEAEELHRIISASVRDMLDAYRIQASAGPVTDKALEEIIFRAARGVVQSLVPSPGEQQIALLLIEERPRVREQAEGLGPSPDPVRGGNGDGTLNQCMHIGRCVGNPDGVGARAGAREPDHSDSRLSSCHRRRHRTRGPCL
jgi:hypothetical protein